MLAKMRTAFATLAILATLAARVFAQDPGSNATADPDHPYSSVWLWTALGDSFSAGIGAGAEYGGGSGDCRRRQGAHAVQLNPLMSPFVRFSFRSCSSAKMDDVQTKQLPELQADNIADQHLVLLSIGGNDADFATLVDACITQAWYGSCDKRLAVANENIDRLAPKLVHRSSPVRCHREADS
ncbi:SGNH hydrolase-type esterase domain-containing protein [Leptodontidium sp. 2 PMI_412]|nr:SGNH hydrolase-type esterase domain-containing protein [Leptodontidium sp. 2 PMI_412]